MSNEEGQIRGIDKSFNRAHGDCRAHPLPPTPLRSSSLRPSPPLPSPPSPDPLPRTRSDGNAVIYARFPRQGLEEKTCPLGKAFGARRGRRTAYLEPCGRLMAAGLEDARPGAL